MPTLLNLFLGLLGLSLVIIIHELGHFFTARAAGIRVERLSLFLGKPLWSKKWNGCEFAIAWIPLGGYCKMKGENLPIQGASEAGDTGKGSFFAAHPLQRAGVAFAGPLFNILFAFLIFFLFQINGYTEVQAPSRIVLLKNENRPSPAQRAGLEDGDIIVQIGNRVITRFNDIIRSVILAPEKTLSLKYQRNGKMYQTFITPQKDREGYGTVGLSPWIDLTVAEVISGSPAAGAGFQAEDRIIGLNGRRVQLRHELNQLLSAVEPDSGYNLQCVRKGKEFTLLLKKKDFDGLRFLSAKPIPKVGWLEGLQNAATEVRTHFQLNLLSLAKLFRGGLDWKESIAGPFRISDQIGQIITDGNSGILERWYHTWNILSAISLMIALINLLPLALLDGGQIVLFVSEWLKGSPLPAFFVRIYQGIGFAFIIAMMLLVLSLEVRYYFL